MGDIFTIASLRGGLNNTDPPISLADDQVVTATNVEWVRSELGDRRRGSTAVDTTGSDIDDAVEIFWIYRHLPDSDERNAQLWVWYRDAGATAYLVYKDTTWHTVAVSDTLEPSLGYPYRVQGATLHGKLFIFYKSAVDRSHVFDPNTSTTALRRVGMAVLSTAPTGADTAAAGTYATVRYFRTREVVQVSSVDYLVSEPSDVLTHTPPGNKTGVIVTKPATVNTDPAATHWRLEESIDNANFYIIATTAIATTTYTDTNTAAQVTTNFELSEDSGDYTPPGSYEFGIADDDRLVFVKQYEGLSSAVAWTPVANATGVGNDERIPIDPESTLSLEDLTGGGIRAVSRAVAGEIWAGKNEHIYKLTRTGRLAPAYAATLITSAKGMVRGSLAEIVGPDGAPALFFADPATGPHLIGRNGIQPCGKDIFATWKGVTLNAPIVARCLYYPEANQVHLWVHWVDPETEDRGALSFGANTTTLRLVLQMNAMRWSAEGWRRGWSRWDGTSANALNVCLYSDNIDDDTDRSIILRPFVASTTVILRTDTGDADNGTEYDAVITTKPYAPTHLHQHFEIQSAVLVAKAEDDATLTISAIPDGGVSTTKLGDDIDCTPAGSETFVIKPMDDLGIAEMRTVQIQFADTETPGARWELGRFTMLLTPGQET